MRVFSFKGGKGARGGAPKCQIQIVLLSDLARVAPKSQVVTIPFILAVSGRPWHARAKGAKSKHAKDVRGWCVLPGVAARWDNL